MEKIHKAKNYRHPNTRLKNTEVIHMRNAFINSMYHNAPLNRHLTINVEEITGQGAYQKILKGIRDMYTKYAKSRDFKSAFLMVVESGDVVGLHLHILFHIPACNQHKLINNFKIRVKRFLSKHTNQNSLIKSSFNFGSLKYGGKMNRASYYKNLFHLCDNIIRQQNSMNVIDLHLYHSTPPDTIKPYFVDDRALINIFNYLCKGISEHSQGAFNCRRFTCSRWLKAEPKTLKHLPPLIWKSNDVADRAA